MSCWLFFSLLCFRSYLRTPLSSLIVSFLLRVLIVLLLVYFKFNKNCAYNICKCTHKNNLSDVMSLEEKIS